MPPGGLYSEFSGWRSQAEETMSNLTPEQMAALNEFGEAQALADYLRCAPPSFARPFRLEAKRVGSAWVSMIPELDSAFFNRIVGLGVGEPLTESLLDEAIGVYQQAGCKNYLAQVSPLAQPAQSLEWLKARGFAPSMDWAKVYRGDEPAPVISTHLRVETIRKDQAEAYADVVLSAFEMPSFLRPLVKGTVCRPGWHHCLACDGETPVSAAAMFVDGEVGWYGFAATVKSGRKRGGQSALLARLIESGRELGCKWSVAETGEDTPEDPNPSYHNMLRCGFQLAYLRRNYVHLAAISPARQARRALFVAAHTLKYEWQRLQTRQVAKESP
jgi:hypothetical protein